MKVVYRFLNVSLPRCTSPNYLPPSITLIFHQIVANLGLESGYKAGPITIPRHNTDIALTTRMHQCSHEYHKKWSGFLSDLPFNTASFGETYSGKEHKEHTFLGSVYLNSNMIACVRWIHNEYKFPLYGEKSNWVLWVWISITKIGFT